MSHDNRQDAGANQRACQRLKVSRHLLVEFDSGDILTGKSRDISPRGILMDCESTPAGENLVDRNATLYIISDEGRFSIGYPCRVVRQERNAVALEIHKNAAAAFGNYMTRDLLGM